MSGTGIGNTIDPLPYSEISKGIVPAVLAHGTGPSFSEHIPGDKGPTGEVLPSMKGGKHRKIKSKKSKKSRKNKSRRNRSRKNRK
jgi:hypothetical protein